MLPARVRLVPRISRNVATSRLYVTRSVAASAPMPQLKEDDSATSAVDQIIRQSGSKTRLGNSESPKSKAKKIVALPSLLPTDSQDQNTAAHHSLYPTSGVIDSASMIGICLRRKDHIPRAYQIFRQLMADYEAGVRGVPDADIFGRVVEGVSTLGQEGMPNYEHWRSRAERMIDQWEAVYKASNGYAALGSQGIKVYLGWFSGMVA